MSSGSVASGWSLVWGTGTGIFAKHNPVVKMQVKDRTVNKTANPKNFCFWISPESLQATNRWPNSLKTV